MNSELMSTGLKTRMLIELDIELIDVGRSRKLNMQSRIQVCYEDEIPAYPVQNENELINLAVELRV